MLKNSKNNYPFILTACVLFLILLPLSLKIIFSQNDDWVYYKMIQSFMSGNLVLDPISAPTFYLQGLLGAGFSFLFGIRFLPVLTLLIAVTNFLVFVLLAKKISKDSVFSVLVGLLLFTNPLYVYSIWGFMTEHYFMLFTTISMFFIYSYTQDQSNKNFVLTNIFIILSFFVRQLAFVTSLSFGIYLLCKKQWKPALIQLSFFVVLFSFYTFIFPRTAEMFEKSLEFKNLLEFSYTYSLVYAILLYVCAFTAPVAVLVLKVPDKKWHVLLFVTAVVLAYVLLNKYFDPHKLAWGEFFYLDNVLERKGFFPRGIDGTKYFFRGIYDLYRYWESFAKILASVLVTWFIVKPKKLLNPFFFFIVIYMCVMVLTQKVYDRYLLILVEVSLLYFVHISGQVSFLKKLLIVPFILFLALYSYQFSMDFILLNTYVWDKGNEVSTITRLPKNDIMGTNSWKLVNPNPLHNYKYIFTFDSYKTKPELKCCWTLLEIKEINFPYSLFIEPKIYLYQSNTL